MEFDKSFEVDGQEYEPDERTLITQINTDLIPDAADYAFNLRFKGENEVIICFSTFEIDLPIRIKQVEETVETRFKEYEKMLKKRFKELCKKTLNLKEKKDLRNHNSEKVSLNNRYYYRSFRTYEYK